MYSFGDLKTGECNLELFAHCLEEVALWSTWLPFILDENSESNTVQWFRKNLTQLMEQARYKRLREKMPGALTA